MKYYTMYMLKITYKSKEGFIFPGTCRNLSGSLEIKQEEQKQLCMHFSWSWQAATEKSATSKE